MLKGADNDVELHGDQSALCAFIASFAYIMICFMKYRFELESRRSVYIHFIDDKV